MYRRRKSVPEEIEGETEAERIKRVAKSLIDDNAPTIDVMNYVRFSMFKQDISTLNRMQKDNVLLLKHIIETMWTGGSINTFAITHKTNRNHRFQVRIKELEEIEMNNYKLGERLAYAKAKVNTNLKATMAYAIQHRKYDLQEHVLKKYDKMDLPSCISLRRKLIQPVVFLELKERQKKQFVPLGRVVIRLYTAAAPQVVREFMRVFRAKHFEQINFVKSFPDLWAVGNLTMEEDPIADRGLEFDLRCFDHNDCEGILSFPKTYREGFSEGIIDFRIAFRPIQLLNGDYVGFGKVIRGMDIVLALREYGTPKGKIVRKVIVTDCGVLAK